VGPSSLVPAVYSCGFFRRISRYFGALAIRRKQGAAGIYSMTAHAKAGEHLKEHVRSLIRLSDSLSMKVATM
jgi:hypothetical protein